MVDDPNLLGFGWFLVLGSIVFILSIRGSTARTTRSSSVPPIEAIAPTQEQDLTRSPQHLQAELHQLQQQCLRLREELQQQKAQLTEDIHLATFESLQPLLTNYPTAQKMAQAKPDLPAQNLIALFTPLENLLIGWNILPIGAAWEQVPYSPEWHQPDTDDLMPNELVYIRFVGYRQGDRILVPARVSRSLPV
jgi:molecular chaperone GrpE (heat shock protein)